jgi:tetrapyrrole methylase family protein/MazG family protein
LALGPAEKIFMENAKTADKVFRELIEAMARLRGDGGCPWDKEQTHASLKASLLEESHELMEAIDAEEPEKLKEELGDVLHQIVFHCQIAAEKGFFSLADIAAHVKDKMIRRHPHVFVGYEMADTAAVLKQWARIKAEERKKGDASALGDLPRSMPALARAQRIAERASSVGFDWPSRAGALDKVAEEMNELKAARGDGQDRVREELGDLLFSLVNLARFFGVEAEEALREATNRFQRRFAHIERTLKQRGKELTEATLAEMDALWEEAKAMEAET